MEIAARLEKAARLIKVSPDSKRTQAKFHAVYNKFKVADIVAKEAVGSKVKGRDAKDEKKDKVHVAYFFENRRVRTIAYQLCKATSDSGGKEEEQIMKIKFGAVVFRKETEDEGFNQTQMTQEAIRRMQTCGFCFTVPMSEMPTSRKRFRRMLRQRSIVIGTHTESKWGKLWWRTVVAAGLVPASNPKVVLPNVLAVVNAMASAAATSSAATAARVRAAAAAAAAGSADR